MYDALDIHGFVRSSSYLDVKKIQQQFKEYQATISILERENDRLRKENDSLGQQNAVLAALVRSSTGIQYKSDYE